MKNEQKGAPHFSFTPTFVRSLYVAGGWTRIWPLIISCEEILKSRRRGRAAAKPAFAPYFKMDPVTQSSDKYCHQILESLKVWPLNVGSKGKKKTVVMRWLWALTRCTELRWSSFFLKQQLICSDLSTLSWNGFALVNCFWKTKYKNFSSLHLCGAFLFQISLDTKIFTFKADNSKNVFFKKWVFILRTPIFVLNVGKMNGRSVEGRMLLRKMSGKWLYTLKVVQKNIQSI